MTALRLRSEIARLREAPASALANRYEQLYGTRPPTRQRRSLWRAILRRLQEQGALEQLAQLDDELPE